MKLTFATFSMMLVSCLADNPEAAGTVAWGRDLNSALAASRESGRPVFALFQEIPGCAGCRQFGRDVLSNSLLVEAIQTEFTPLLIHNNKAGADAEVLRQFGEPAWNYQVVRFLDAKGRDIIPRKGEVWDTAGIAERMVAALQAANRAVPPYLPLLASEHSERLRQAVFSMYCFWTGEMELGRIEGVVTTEAGFMGGREVTLVQYDPAVITLPNLIAAAEKVQCANSVAVPAADLEAAKSKRLKVTTISGYTVAPADDQKKQISGTVLTKLKLAGAQATKVNAWCRVDSRLALSYLTQAQRKLVAE